MDSVGLLQIHGDPGVIGAACVHAGVFSPGSIEVPIDSTLRDTASMDADWVGVFSQGQIDLIRTRLWNAVRCHGLLIRYVELRVVHAPGMPGTFSMTPRVSDHGMHHDTCVMHVSWYMPGSLTSGFLWSRWRGKRSQHSRRIRNQQIYVSGKTITRLILDLRPANESRPYFVTTSLIGWAQA